ncbi:MAG: LeuA family protein [Bacteroidetes bacterium]|nr:LeuA family protein [Bacteroidota bacterium]MBU1720209.1 LeuA family protein [Bacteroidota bacterium]
MTQHELIYDWNIQGATPEKPRKRIEFDDETLRDGMQSPTIKSPKIGDKIKILHLMNDLGIDSADIGLPGAGPMVVEDVTVLAREICNNKLNIRASCAARTVITDIAPISDISQKTGMPICVDMFIGSSTIRSYAENWSMERMLKNTEDSIRFARKNNLPVMYVTEDTTRAHPETIKALYKCAIENGVDRICVCDTVGHATPYGIINLIRFVQNIIKETGAEVKLDFHGHSDRGLALPNTIAAIIAGADRVHGCGHGIGERCGNTPMDLLLVNLKLMGWIDNPLTRLPEYCELICNACDIPIPCNYPVMGKDAFRTATGVHAATIIKALKKETDVWLADAVYSGVPASMVGLKQNIEIGPMSGKSNVIFWLEERNINPTPELVEMVFDQAKRSSTILSEDEINSIIVGMFRKARMGLVEA